MINKTFRLFISSTFNDFLDERKILNDEIFNEIDIFCRSKGYFFQLIDLRWGINNETAINQNTMAVCLDEVNRCKKLSPKPNFLVMIGERYGWIPLPAKITSRDFEMIMSLCDESETSLLQEWYRFDKNEIGGEYYLKARQNAYIDDDVWAETEKKLCAQLVFCAQKCGFSTDKIKEITSSATEKEIIEGFLGTKDICDNSIAFFRNGYSEKDKNIEPIQNLREKILTRMKQDGCTDNIIELDYSEKTEYLEQFKQKIIEKIKQNITTEITRIESEIKATEDIVLLEELTSETGFFHAREDELHKLSDYINSDKQTPLFLTGESGSGKTTILTEFIKRAMKENKNVVYGFFGFDDSSYTLLNVLQKICFKIKNDYEITSLLELNQNNITEAFCHTIYAIPENEKIVIVIDGLDMFLDISSIHESVFPSRLPKNVKIIVSAADKNVVDSFIDPGFETLKIEGFNKKESHEMLNFLLERQNRQISSTHQQKAIDNAIGDGTTPLHLKLISEISCKWRSDDEIVELGTSSDETALQFIENMFLKFGHNESVVLTSIAFIAASPYGVTEEELIRLLFTFDDVQASFVKEDRYSYNLKKMPFVIWSRLFYDLKGCFAQTWSNHSVVVVFSHNIFKKVFNEKYGFLCNDATQKMITFFSQQSNYENGKGFPNTRKVLMLPALLHKCNKVEELKALYSDIRFINASILSGCVNETILNLQYIFDKQTAFCNNTFLFKIFSCIQKNNEILRYYKNSLYDIASETGLIELDEEPIIQKISGDLNANMFLPFPYASEAKVSWYSDGKRYAVYLNSYVYICCLPTCVELCKIFVDITGGFSKNLVQQVVWMDENTIAIMTEDEKLIVYDFTDMIPNKIAEYECSYPSIEYDSKNKRLIFINKNSLYSVDPFNNKEIFTIGLKKKTIFAIDSFDFIPETCQIVFKNKYNKIFIYNSNNGDLIDVISLDNVSYSGRTLGRVVQLSKNNWLIHNGKFFSIYDSDKQEEQFLMLPFSKEAEQILIGKQNLVLFEENLLILINLENLEMRYYRLDDVFSCDWKIPDEELSLVTSDGIGIIKISDFKSFDKPIHCMTNKKEILESKETKKTFTEFSVTFKRISNWSLGFFGYKKYDYDSLFAQLNDMDKLTEKVAQRASLVKFANDGKKVIVYEGSNALTVLDNDDRPILQIDRLGLSLVDGILGLEFSPNSNLLLIWRHLSIRIFDIAKGKCISFIDLSFIPAIKACFNDDSSLTLILCNDEIYEYDIYKHHYIGNKPPKKIIEKRLPDSHMGAYTYLIDGDESFPVSIMTNFSFGESPRKWLNNQRLYYSDGWEDGLFYDSGEFFLMYRESEALQNPFYDFTGMLNAERIKDSTYLGCFLREKNDVFSSLYNDTLGKYLILISRMLNSVIVIDKLENKVVTAYKHPSNIIGERLCDDNVIEIISNQKPYKTLLKINLP